MDATTSAVLAIIAVVVAGASAVAAIWSVRQTARYHPKPLMIGSLELVSSPRESTSVRFNVYNRGNGVAYDFTVTLANATLSRVYNHEPELVPGKGIRHEFIVSANAGERDAHGNIPDTTGTADAHGMYFFVTWRQAPNMAKLRRKEFRLPTS